ncbi:LAME_0E13014g1_1 [Lachancea meyersii CBS 8951]|uniref:LAME_0E13014g1_1 n=1 Tax=Lachancea meyersii CBS 8951 TaxID=1266667 RepID=A0A1G4JM18_9SACH|nr:LAME_0E13014g1_1 [Lachancea meyersii CBS 8951]
MSTSNKSKRRQKSKKVSKSAKNGDSRQDLLKVVDQIKAKRNNQNPKPKSPGDENTAQTNTVKSQVNFEQFKKVFAKFQPLEANGGSNTEQVRTHSRRGKIFEQDGNYSGKSSLVNAEEQFESLEESPQLSKRKKRQLSKVSLAELKSIVIYPELVQWYDCDAPDPVTLAKIKCSKNVVQVPNHWQLKREYLSGRSVVAKKPFELPDIIRQTNIEEMRNTLPTQDSNDEKSLKENARARIRPKLGSLDLDYRKLHDAFFKLGRHWKPDHMLKFGDMFYENRNLEEERKWAQMERKLRPGKLSRELRQAMGLPEGKLPPWCSKFTEVGMPPSYPDYKVAGVNWDISNLHDDIYGTLGPLKDAKHDTPLFGQMIQLDDASEDAQDYEKPHDNEQEPTAKIGEEPAQHKDRIEIDQKLEDEIRAKTMKEVLKRRAQEKALHGGQEGPKTLYSVIRQKENAGDSELTGSNITYDLNGLKQKNGSTEKQKRAFPREPQRSTDQHSNGDRDEQNFKF